MPSICDENNQSGDAFLQNKDKRAYLFRRYLLDTSHLNFVLLSNLNDTIGLIYQVAELALMCFIINASGFLH